MSSQNMVVLTEDNEEGSQIWTDAKQLEDQVNHAWKTNISTGVFPKPKDEPVTKGRGKKNARASTTPVPAEEPRRSITLNIKPPLPPVKEASPAPKSTPRTKPAPSPALGTRPTPSPALGTRPAPSPALGTRPAPSPALGTRPAPSPALVPPPPPPVATPAPAAPSPSFSAATLAAAMQHVPVSAPPVEAGPPGVNQYTTPAALARPRSPDPGVTADRIRTAAMDKQFIDRFDANLEQWRGPEIQLPPGRKTAGVEGSGWFGQGAPEYEARNGGSSSWPGRISSVLHAVTEYRDAR